MERALAVASGGSPLVRAHPSYAYHRLGGGKGLVAGQIRPNAPRAFADPIASVAQPAQSSRRQSRMRPITHVSADREVPVRPCRPTMETLACSVIRTASG